MKCVVVYFSLSGNTEKIAMAIQKGIKEVAGHCDLLPIKEANPRRLNEYDLIGLGTPIMGPALTLNVKNFIRNMRYLGGKHAFPFCTHCTLWYWFFPDVVPRLMERGMTVIGWGDWFGSSFGQLMENTPYWTDGHPDEIDLKDAEAFGKEMVERSKKISAGETSLIPEVPQLPAYLDPVFRPDPATLNLDPKEQGKKMDFQLNYNKKLCKHPKCHLCMDVCPMDGIDLTIDPPVIPEPGENCITCMMCDQVCPTGAMSVDERIFRNERPGLEEHMQFKVDLVAQMEKEGTFRRLLPEEKVGYTPVGLVYKKRPRFIIGKGRPYGFDPWTLTDKGE